MRPVYPIYRVARNEDSRVLAKKCPKNYVSSLNSRAAIVDESNNFPTATIFSRKSSWLKEELYLNLLRLSIASAQLQPAKVALAWAWGSFNAATKPSKMASCGSYGKDTEKKSTRETFFVLVGLAFCALRVSIRV